MAILFAILSAQVAPGVVPFSWEGKSYRRMLWPGQVEEGGGFGEKGGI
jgi:hypothetical protein